MKVHGHDPEGGQGPQNGQEKLHAQARKRMARGQETRDQAQKRQDKDTVRMKSPEEEWTRPKPEANHGQEKVEKPG